MPGPVTKVLWITRQRTTHAHIRGLLVGLEQLGAVALAEVEIATVTENDAYLLPKAPWRFPDGRIVESGYTFTLDSLPPTGVLLVANEESDT